ncbi:MAG: calcium/sodium antiporter [Cetobacterium sp.]|uniref:Cation:H+ antiporter n=1 Tax=Cetobacterium ceti TaxID=180163 RepID=A0A1T4M9H4_9FUSO|nr:calcium/sodium antiporter [Cetobacterium ceti]MCJ8342868.1 calcium/sodium antiporter [Cetobacterium sp.]SJZ63582.1 cation:H+ antiporter [Cetobacterium ceti]
MVYLLLLVSFVILIKGADIFIEGSAKVAKIFKIPELIIGIVIVGFGTSAPELAVNIAAVFKGSNEMAVGNIVGSNVFNILFIVGAIAFFKPMSIDDKLATFDFPISVLAAILLPFFALSGRYLPFNSGFSRLDGIILLLIFAYYCKETISRSLVDQKLKDKKIMLYQIAEGSFSLTKHLEGGDSEKPTKKALTKDIILIIVGLVCVIKGGDMVVEYASRIAVDFGMSNHLVGLTIVGIGTSLPELVVSIIAAKRGQQDIVLGNVVGSNTFNILFTLGITMLLRPIAVNESMIVDTVTVALATTAVGMIALANKSIGKKMSVAFVVIYLIYMGNVIINA